MAAVKPSAPEPAFDPAVESDESFLQRVVAYRRFIAARQQPDQSAHEYAVHFERLFNAFWIPGADTFFVLGYFCGLRPDIRAGLMLMRPLPKTRKALIEAALAVESERRVEVECRAVWKRQAGRDRGRRTRRRAGARARRFKA